VVPWGGHEHLGVRPLAAPLLAVGVEDATAEHVEHQREHNAFG
jgi:hypothetical protein